MADENKLKHMSSEEMANLASDVHKYLLAKTRTPAELMGVVGMLQSGVTILVGELAARDKAKQEDNDASIQELLH